MRFVVATKLKFSQQKLIFPIRFFFCSLFLYYMNECLFFVNKIQTKYNSEEKKKNGIWVYYKIDNIVAQET